MTKSLKSMFPALGGILDMSPDQLYGCQRAFVAAGILNATPGRGPGSGVHAGPDTVAQFLIGLITRASSVENVPIARALGNARGDCPITGAKRFKDALAGILASEEIAGRVDTVDAHISACTVIIRYVGAPKFSPFLNPAEFGALRAAHPFKIGVFGGTPKMRNPIHYDASIPGHTLVSLARAITEAGGGK
jgi:hypothetical protein